MSGTTVVQIIGLLLSPIITRLFTKQDFITLEQYTMILVIFGVFVTGKYELAIVQPKKQRDAISLVKLCFWITILVSLIALVLLIFGRNIVGEWYQNNELAFWLLFLPINLLFLGLSNASTYWVNRIKKFKISAFSKVLFSGVNEPLKIGFGSAGFLSGGLIISNLLSRGIVTLYLFFAFWKRNNEEYHSIKAEEVKTVAKTYKNYLQYITFGSLFGRAATWIHIFLFSTLYGPWLIAFIALSRRVFLGPISILSQSFSQVFYQHISEIEAPILLKKTYLKFLLRFSLIGALGTVFIWLLPENTMGFIFGEKWFDTLMILRILVFWFALNFITSALSFMFHRLARQKAMLKLDILHFAIVVLSILMGYWMGYSEIDCLKIFVVAKAIYFIFIILVTIHFLNQEIKNNTKRFEDV